jgi:biotin carboxyl carrier protein
MKGGKLAIAENILKGLQEWKTLLPRPPIVRQLLKNHGLSPEHKEEKIQPIKHFDQKEKHRELQDALPRTPVTNREIATVEAFGNIGLTFLKKRDKADGSNGPSDMTSMMDTPEFTHSEFKKVGDAFILFGKTITITKINSSKQPGKIDVDYSYEGHHIRTTGIDPKQITSEAIKQVKYVKDKTREVGASMPSSIVSFFAKPGDFVKKGQPVVTTEAMKMQHSLVAPRDGVIESLHDFDTSDPAKNIVERNEVLFSLK